MTGTFNRTRPRGAALHSPRAPDIIPSLQNAVLIDGTGGHARIELEKSLRFSIVTPSFRSSRWLPLCIASVADQEGVELEHIVQDSCSDDGTQEWLPRDARVKAFIEKDSGMYDAVNRGFRRS